MSEIERAIEKKEYIERGALIAFVREVRKNLPKDSKDFFTRDEMLLNFQQYLELQKSADVEPVVRGEWDKTKDKEHDFRTYYCSVCGKREYYFNATQYAYCPHCGARMQNGAHMERSEAK